jgi:hypothetical protein
VSRHWKPEVKSARVVPTRVRKPWPAGATAGLVLVASACLCVAVVLYHVAGPRDVFEEDAPFE